MEFHFKQLNNNPDLAKVLVQESGGQPANESHWMKNSAIGVPEIFHKMLDESKQKGEIRDIDTELFGAISFGLLSLAKGLEYGIEAVAKVEQEYENLVYLILGKTHPCVKERNGESYRDSLITLAERLGVRDNIRLIDDYLTKEEVITYLKLSDIYMTPYLSKEQAVSGTLAYAMGCGRVVVTTPYCYAQELPGDGRGNACRI